VFRVNQSDASHGPHYSEPTQAGQGGALITLTVPTKLRRGQVVKHHSLWVSRPDHVILTSLCSSGLVYACGSGRKGRIARAHLA